MVQKNKTVEAYIAGAADFAKPILEKLRTLILETCPEVQEDIKWGIPHYTYKGDYLVIMAAYKNHCSFSLYKAEFMKDKQVVESVKAGKKYGYMDKLKSVDELPPENVLITHIKEAMTINARGIKTEIPKSDKPKVMEIPDYFEKALENNPQAKAVFYDKSNSFRKEYIVWITDAKTEATRQKRIEQSLEWIEEGKGRFWQYQK